MGWIGVDLDGTLAVYPSGRGHDVIGAPVPLMVEQVRRWLNDGREVRVFTARVSGSVVEAQVAEHAIQRWCSEHIGQRLRVTCMKDYGMIELWDDRAVSVAANTGTGYRCGEKVDGPA